MPQCFPIDTQVTPPQLQLVEQISFGTWKASKSLATAQERCSPLDLGEGLHWLLAQAAIIPLYFPFPSGSQ